MAAINFETDFSNQFCIVPAKVISWEDLTVLKKELIEAKGHYKEVAIRGTNIDIGYINIYLFCRFFLLNEWNYFIQRIGNSLPLGNSQVLLETESY